MEVQTITKIVEDPTVEAFTGVLSTEVSCDIAYSDYDMTFEKRTGAIDAFSSGNLSR